MSVKRQIFINNKGIDGDILSICPLFLIGLIRS